MNKIVLSVCTMIAMSSLVVAGGGMKEVAPAVEPVIVIPAVDESSVYVGIGIAAVSTRDADVSIDFIDEKGGQDRLGNVSLLAGYDFNHYIAVEGRYTTSIADEDSVEMDGWSLFVKPQYTFDDSNFKIYALLGFGGVTLDSTNSADIVDVDDTGFQWGIGAAYSFGEYMDNNDLALFVDYTSLASEMEGIYWNGALETDVDAVTVGLTYKF